MFKNRLRSVLTIAGIILLILIIWNIRLIGYGIAQARGQFAILWQAREVEEVMQDPATSDLVREKLKLVADIRHFAMDTLGLDNSSNYTTYYDQQGKPILWVVTASAPFALEPYEWSFPVVGTVPYKGYFEKEKAETLARDLEEEEYDVYMREVTGWSTLGWFRDPILSEMLNRSVGSLAELIIHELTHSTIFVRDSVTFNENLASFIGYKGALMFLRSRYGHTSKELVEYAQLKEDSYQWSRHFINGANRLDSLYRQMEGLTTDEKATRKEEVIDSIVNQLDTIKFHNPGRYQRAFQNNLPNNAWFLSFLRYRGGNDKLERLLEEYYQNDLKAFIYDMKGKYPYL